jgi:hypothetical protein
MNDKTGGNRGLRRAVALAVVAAVAVLATACGSSSPSSASSARSGSYPYAQVLAVAQCIRGHGVPNFPDPDASGNFSSNVLPMIDSSQGQAAYGACRHLLAGAPSIAQLQQGLQQEQQEQQKVLLELLKFSQCMRGHGVPNYPDPTVRGQGISGNLKGAGINSNSPQFQAAASACQHLVPGLHMSSHASSHVS